MEFGVGIALKYVYPFILACIVVEFLTHRHEYNLKDSAASLGVAAGATLINVFSKVVVLGIFFLVSDLFEPVRMSLFGYDTFGFAWYVWALALLGDDFSFYWHHRFSHSIRLLWAAHIAHHSSRQFNFSMGLRNGWFITFYKEIFWLWLPIIGFEPLMVSACLIISATYQFFLHTKTVGDLGALGKVFNNPWVHQVHHSCNVEYLDKNHGGILMIWDRIFGTWAPRKKHVTPKFGVIHDPNSFNPIIINTHEFRDIFRDMRKVKKLKHKLMYMFGPPGWSHDGSSLTTKQWQRVESSEHVKVVSPNLAAAS